MTPWWWSWLLTTWGIAGLVLAGRRRAVGWAIGLSAQGAWIAYAVATRQWGFIASALAYGGAYFANWRSWRATAVDVPAQSGTFGSSCPSCRQK